MYSAYCTVLHCSVPYCTVVFLCRMSSVRPDLLDAQVMGFSKISSKLTRTR